METASKKSPVAQPFGIDAIPGQVAGAPPKVGVVLAAGNGLRMKDGGVPMPKVLLKVGGMHLVERAVLTLRFAGLDRIRVVLGNEAERLEEAISKMPNLRGLPIELVRCEDFQRGNGASLRAGALGLDEPFLVTMADHVLSVEMVRELVVAAGRDCLAPHLLVDPDPDNVFDLDDATKVQTRNGAIASIGKELDSYDVIDTGVFHFPAWASREINAAVEEGANSVSEIVARLMSMGRFGTVSASNPIWQDVDTPAMAREAERMLLRKLARRSVGEVDGRPLRALTPSLAV